MRAPSLRQAPLLKGGLIFALALAATGCLNLSKPYPDIHYYSLDVAREANTDASSIGTILNVHKFRVSPRFQTSELVYRISDTGYESDFYHQWLVSPDAMMTSQVRNWFRRSGVFAHVIEPSSYAEATHILEGAVTALYGDLRNPQQTSAVLEIHAVLMRDRAGGPEILFHKEYREELLMVDKSAASLVDGLNKAFHRIVKNLEADLRSIDVEDTEEPLDEKE